MPTAISDPSSTLYAILAIIVAILLFVSLRTRKRNDLIRFGIAAAALVALFVTDKLFESPREEATHKMQEMAKATETKDWDAFTKNVSDSFTYKTEKGELTKAKMVEGLKALSSLFPEFKGITVWDFHRADFKPVDNKHIQIGFRAQAREHPETQSWVIADYVLDPDGQWRMSGFARYDFAKQDRMPKQPIPGLD